MIEEMKNNIEKETITIQRRTNGNKIGIKIPIENKKSTINRKKNKKTKKNNRKKNLHM